MPPDKVNQATLYQGGKYCDWGFRKSQLITPLLAKRTGRPVKCVNTRENTVRLRDQPVVGACQSRVQERRADHRRQTLHRSPTMAPAAARPSAPLMDMNYPPWYTTRCENIDQNMDAVSTNRGKMYLSGQHCLFGWDTMTVAEQMIARKTGHGCDRRRHQEPPWTRGAERLLPGAQL